MLIRTRTCSERADLAATGSRVAKKYEKTNDWPFVTRSLYSYFQLGFTESVRISDLRRGGGGECNGGIKFTFHAYRGSHIRIRRPTLWDGRETARTGLRGLLLPRDSDLICDSIKNEIRGILWNSFGLRGWFWGYFVSLHLPFFPLDRSPTWNKRSSFRIIWIFLFWILKLNLWEEGKKNKLRW